MSNSQLKNYYEDVYSKDKNQHFLKYRDGKILSETHLKALDWIKAKSLPLDNLLDFGCGEGDFLGSLPDGEKQIGIDYSPKAVENALKKYPTKSFLNTDEGGLKQFDSSLDLVFSFGTLEHMDAPEETLRKICSCTKKGGYIFISCPSFLNVRGVIWMTMSLLWDVPMSLSDKHFLTIKDFERMSKNLGIRLIESVSSEIETAQGKHFEVDMKKRLKNALRDSKMDNSKVDKCIDWFQENIADFALDKNSGAETLYILKK